MSSEQIHIDETSTAAMLSNQGQDDGDPNTIILLEDYEIGGALTHHWREMLALLPLNLWQQEAHRRVDTGQRRVMWQMGHHGTAW